MCGMPGVGRSPTPDRPFLGAYGRGTLPTSCGCGGAGAGSRHQPNSARSSELALRAVEAAGGCPVKALLACVWDVRGWALSDARPPVLRAFGRGPLPTGCGGGGCGRADPP